jgi:predicted acylesterase/phospholipase RssA
MTPAHPRITGLTSHELHPKGGSPDMKALVLTGGGARGAYEAGVVRGLADAGEAFDLVCGTSIGAINAAFYAQDLLPELEQTWKSIASRSIIALSPEAESIKNFITGFEDLLKLPKWVWAVHIVGLCKLYHAIGPIAQLRSLLSALDRAPIAELLQPVLNINNLKRSLVVTATNVTLQTSESFYAFVDPNPGPEVNALQQAFIAKAGPAHRLTSENVLDAIEASSAIPFAFPPVNQNLGTPSTFLYVDGGVANNTPIGLAISAGATDITAIFMDPKSGAPAPQAITNAADLGMACYSVMQQKLLADDMKLALMTNKAIAAEDAGKSEQLGLTGKVQVALRQVRPQHPLGLSVLGFNDQTGLNTAFELGRQDASSVKIIWALTS